MFLVEVTTLVAQCDNALIVPPRLSRLALALGKTRPHSSAMHPIRKRLKVVYVFRCSPVGAVVRGDVLPEGDSQASRGEDAR